MLPRAQFDVSALYYQKDLFSTNEDNKTRNSRRKYGYDLMPPDTWEQVSDQAIFFADPHQIFTVLSLRARMKQSSDDFYELVISEGGQLFNDDWSPAFNSEAGVRALNWFVKMYESGAVPAGYDFLSYGMNWALVLHRAPLRLNLDWPGWAGFFNDPESSKVAGNVGVVVQPQGSAGIRTGWSGHHGFLRHRSPVKTRTRPRHWWHFLTNEESQKLESSAGPLPTRKKVWDHVVSSKLSTDAVSRGSAGSVPGSFRACIPCSARHRTG